MGNLNDVFMQLDQTSHYGKLYLSVRSKFDEFNPTFESLPLNERFSFLYKYALSNDLLCELQIEPTKSVTKALQLKLLGNKAFVQKKFMKALRLYTKSLAFAPPNSEELAIAYANRAAALFRLDRFEACMVDVNRALKENHSGLAELWVEKLVKRKWECVVKLEEYRAAETNRLVCLSSSIIDDDTLEDWIRHRKNECKFDENAMDINYEEKFFLPTGNLKNPLIPNASTKFKVSYSQEFGRHMVATEDIKPGELLHIEKPYASILRFEVPFRCCSYCYVRCEALIPCPTCSRVMYCSVKCRTLANDLYHEVECDVLPIAMKFGESEVAWLALRMLLIATKQGEDLETILKHPAYQEPMKKMDSSLFENFESDFMHVYNLTCNFHRPDGKWHPMCINAVLTLYILKHSKFFTALAGEKINHETLTDVEARVGNLLFRLILIAQSNMKFIGERYEKEKRKDGPLCEMHDVAFGVYPFTSFYNHSCDENVIGSAFHKNTIVIHASQAIGAGQQLCMDYPMFHHETPTEERQESLMRNAYFTCKCEACENDWPIADEFSGLVQNYRLLDDSSSISHEELFRRGIDFCNWQRKRTKKNVHSAKLLKLVCEYSNLFGKVIDKQCYDYFSSQREIHMIFWERANYYKLDQDEVLIKL